MERCLLQLETLAAAGPRGVLALAVASRRCRDAPRPEVLWWTFLAKDFAIVAEAGARAASSAAGAPLPRELYATAASCRLRALSPWLLADADDLRSAADALRGAAAGVRELRRLPPVAVAPLEGDGDELEEDDDGAGERAVQPCTYLDSISFDPADLSRVVSLWERGDESAFAALPGDEIVSDSCELVVDEETQEAFPRVALSVSFAHTTSKYFAGEEDSDEAEYDPLAAPGRGRLLALNLVEPDDDHCAVYFAHSDFAVMGRWAWNSEEYWWHPETSGQVPRRIFQSRGRLDGQFARLLCHAASGRALRTLVISTGVSSNCRDVEIDSCTAPDFEVQEAFRILAADPSCSAEETLFRQPMDVPRPWPDLGAEPALR